MHRPFLPVVVPLFFLTHTAVGAPRIAVVVVGPDPNVAGEGQRAIESSLRELAGLRMLPGQELALRLAALAPGPPPDETLTTLLVEAREAYFDDRLEDLEKRIDSASRLVEAGLGRPGADRVTVLTWKAALRLARGDRVLAHEAVRAALAVSPSHRPDLSVFRPSLAALFEEARHGMPPSVRVQIEGVPPDASIDVGGHFVGTSFRVLPGPQRLRVRAKGYVPAVVVFDARPDLVVRVSPALDVPPSWSREIEEVVWSGNGDHNGLERLRNALAADELVLVSHRADGSVRGAIWRASGELVRSERLAEETRADLIRWLREQLSPTARGWSLRLGAGPVARVRRAGIVLSEGASFDATVGGVGGSLVIAADRGPFGAAVSLAIVPQSSAQTRFRTLDGGETVRGGTFFGGQASAFWTLQAIGLAVRPELAVRFERDDSGGPRSFAVFPAYERTDALAGLSVEAGGPYLRVAGGLAGGGNLSWRALNGWEKPSPSPVLFASARAAWAPSRWELRLGYDLEFRSAAFESYPVPASSPLGQPDVQELVHSVSLASSYRW